MNLRLLLFSLLGLSNMLVLAQDAQGPDMADGLRADGMIWVVVGVILIILAGLFLSLIGLDRRIRRMERESTSETR